MNKQTNEKGKIYPKVKCQLIILEDITELEKQHFTAIIVINEREEVAQIMYIHVSKCKNDKIKIKKKNLK
jgi:hypothetical protein